MKTQIYAAPAVKGLIIYLGGDNFNLARAKLSEYVVSSQHRKCLKRKYTTLSLITGCESTGGLFSNDKHRWESQTGRDVIDWDRLSSISVQIPDRVGPTLYRSQLSPRTPSPSFPPTKSATHSNRCNAW